VSSGTVYLLLVNDNSNNVSVNKPAEQKIARLKATCPIPLFESVWVLLYLAMSEVLQILHRGSFASKERIEL
jgi:hypothetical protein